jgi:hypothetical protein
VSERIERAWRELVSACDDGYPDEVEPRGVINLDELPDLPPRNIPTPTPKGRVSVEEGDDVAVACSGTSYCACERCRRRRRRWADLADREATKNRKYRAGESFPRGRGSMR